MRFGRSKTGAAGHIKHNTKGTSNEISFSVLDSMKGPDEEEDGASPLGRISLFTLGPKRPTATPSKEPSLPGTSSAAHRGASSSSWRTTDSEVQARRKQRRRGRRLAIVIVSIICLIALVLVGILAVGHYQRVQQRALTLSGQIEDVRAEYGIAAQFLELVESTLATPLADVDAAALDQQLTEWTERQQSLSAKMRTSKTAIEGMEEQLRGADLERANKAIAALNATSKAMDAGRSVLTQVTEAARSYAQAASFTTNAVAGDAKARDAVALELVDDAAANAAIEKSNAAISDFAAARDAVQAVLGSATALIEGSGAFNQPASELLTPFSDYANLRIQAQEYAIDADEGYLALSSQQMQEANTHYNATEAQAADLIAGLRGAYPTDVVQQAYDATMRASEDVASWQTEWARAQQELA